MPFAICQRFANLLDGQTFKFKHSASILTQYYSFSSLSFLINYCHKTQFLQQVHARFIIFGFHQNPSLASTLINCYSNLGHLHYAQQVFNSVDDPNALLYNTIIRKLSESQKFHETLVFYNEMVAKSLYPDEFTYPFVLKSCSHLRNIRKIHGHVVKVGYDSDFLVGAALHEMYVVFGRCGVTEEATEGMPRENYLIHWNTLISEESKNGNADECFWLFERMRTLGLEPNSVTVVSLLRASVVWNSLEAGRMVHLLIVLYDLSGDLSVNTALLTMYSKLGSLETANLLFEKMPEKDCVVWNIMISAYSQNGYPNEALELFVRMIKSSVRADLLTGTATISSVAELKSLQLGKQIHAHVIRNGSDYQVSVYNSLIGMYGRCGNLEGAKRIFDLVSNKTVVSWSSMNK